MFRPLRGVSSGSLRLSVDLLYVCIIVTRAAPGFRASRARSHSTLTGTHNASRRNAVFRIRTTMEQQTEKSGRKDVGGEICCRYERRDASERQSNRSKAFGHVCRKKKGGKIGRTRPSWRGIEKRQGCSGMTERSHRKAGDEEWTGKRGIRRPGFTRKPKPSSVKGGFRLPPRRSRVRRGSPPAWAPRPWPGPRR